MNSAAAAHQAVTKAVKRGELPHPRTLLCADCNSPANGYDHRDYSTPLVVAPVCRSCNHKRGQAANHDLGSHDITPFGRWIKRQPRGASAEIARSLEVTRALVAMWAKGVREVSMDKVKRVEAMTGISVRELRPDDWHLYWPEPAAKARKRKPAQEAAA